MKNYLILILFLLTLTMTACSGLLSDQEPTYIIWGEWGYEMYTKAGEGYDAGTIKFTGEPASGGYTLTSFTNGVSHGTYTVIGTNISLTGSVTWEGEFIDDVTITGEWVDDTLGLSGTWTATKAISVYRVPEQHFSKGKATVESHKSRIRWSAER